MEKVQIFDAQEASKVAKEYLAGMHLNAELVADGHNVVHRLAKYLGLGDLFVKDESFRFGLNAFKVLGGSFAMARYIAGEMGRDVSEMNYDYLTSEAFRKEFGQATFFTATDGNHGRGVDRKSVV